MNKQNTNKKRFKTTLRFSLVHGLQEGSKNNQNGVSEVTVAVHAAVALAEVQRPMQHSRINSPRVRLLL